MVLQVADTAIQTCPKASNKTRRLDLLKNAEFHKFSPHIVSRRPFYAKLMTRSPRKLLRAQPILSFRDEMMRKKAILDFAVR